MIAGILINIRSKVSHERKKSVGAFMAAGLPSLTRGEMTKDTGRTKHCKRVGASFHTLATCGPLTAIPAGAGQVLN